MSASSDGGRVVVVTGGSRGIGRAACAAYAARGDTVVVASRRAEACTALAAELTAEHGTPALGVGCHVGRWADCDALVDRVLAEHGRIDVLVNNAGMSPLYGSLTEVTEELFDKVLAVNLRGAYRLGARCGELMAAAGGGAIVNVSSVAAVMPGPGELPYALAKAGLNALTVGLARAYAPSVRVNTVMPGPVRTDIAEHWTEEFRTRIAGTVPAGRVGEAAEVVGAILYLTGPDAGYTTGATIKVDGGMAWST
ncbi:SDR family NAD(P)-dependent oxidoreductase [Pseudonocardia sp. UM4_GMWB1]|jgi:NAD(P)-dependent dehydrogenase (short-subunit alcohol dehydrogenase family)|uniref:SDR family NAD(P)-dependent oxidoreductase n=1 Tax=unclassified Pseudonocardia TaxID=2619320 RepID=UPI00091C6C32|nr:glucose 1-dehydrogenase [Pseudonocardia sp. SID8383]MYW75885.1 glucose 1-dehydrogenase [Pseudonocardia sp. SID8383]OJG06975.1 3-oxoacyl-[acyl-carrier-protein] reductase FabG [Pseudonocardia autotrophica]